jgi:hypothetical protein
MKQAMLSLATGVEVHGRDHVRVVLVFTAVLTVTGGNVGSGAEDRKGVASLIVNFESGFASLNDIVNWFEAPQKKASDGGLTKTVGGMLGKGGKTLIRKSRTIVWNPLVIATAKL